MNKIKELRKEKGITQDKLAAEIGVSRSAISMYEISASEPDIETLKNLAGYFNVSIDYLLDCSNRPNNDNEKNSNNVHLYEKMPQYAEYRESHTSWSKSNDDETPQMHQAKDSFNEYQKAELNNNLALLAKLKNLRITNKKNYKDIAAYLGISEKVYLYYEANGIPNDSAFIKKLEKFYGVILTDFLSEREANPVPGEFIALARKIEHLDEKQRNRIFNVLNSTIDAILPEIEPEDDSVE